MYGHIERLCLHRFRGATTATEVTFDTDTPLVILFGENGTGKSTLIDAIDLVCNREPGSVRDRSSTNARQHLPAIGHQAADLSVEVTYAGKTWRGSHSGRGIVVDGPGEPPQAHILRRHHLLQLVEATPGDRYEALRRFIDVRGVERSEQALRDACNTAGRILEEETRRAEVANDALRELWVAEGRPGSPGCTHLEWAEEKARSDTAMIQRRVSELDGLLRCLDAASRASDSASSAAAETRRCAEVIGRLDHELADAGGPDVEGHVRLVALLRQTAQCLMSPAPVDACPVCQQPVDGDRLRADIAARLSGMARLLDLQSRRDAAGREHDQAVAILARSRAEAIASARDLLRSLQASQAATAAPLPLRWEHYTRLRDADTPDAEWALCEAADLLAAASVLATTLVAERDGLRADLNRYNALKQHHERVTGGEARVRGRQILHRRLHDACEIVRARRLAFTQRVLDGVAEECNRLYASIHPGESLGRIRLVLDGKKRGSLLQDGEFEGYTEVPPQAYFSEAHLDTLGFCLFLALARAFSGGDAIVALDDVFTSADQGHLSRIYNVLREESRRFRQVIITTHQPAWRDLCRGDGMAGVQWISLHPWTRRQGIRTVG